ncbi:MAG TPA: 4Fe-4S dicluster domain-containing protein [Anaeromyxobacteraceae bacterium]|jgi:molybdopterin-containing oxidoreductase family iron-sulfur binding subunit|nr:4Fe-4S dicluster domain-containing protein [Anaeromyxobacteraceae bacterium]
MSVPGRPSSPSPPISRRRFLGQSLAVAASAAAAGCGVEELLGRSFRELSREDVRKVLARAERRQSARFGRPVKVDAAGPLPGVEFGYGLDLSRCIGCRRCVYACVKENNPSRHHPQIHWIRVLELDKARGVDLAHADVYYDAEQVPRPGHFYMPVQCQQCRKPPCVKVCPVGATWQEPDGIVVVDYDWCIGCRCCMAACPYGARHFNWAEPELPAAELNPDTHYLGNRPRPKGVVEKCTFCIQRVRRGRYPACVEACPVGARKFGNLLDPESEIRQAMDRKRVFILKEELGTQPRFFYFYAT